MVNSTQRSCLPFLPCVDSFVNCSTTSQREKQLTFLSQNVFINCVTNLKKSLYILFERQNRDKMHEDGQRKQQEKLIRKAKNQINNWFVLQLTFLCVSLWFFCKYFIFPFLFAFSFLIFTQKEKETRLNFSRFVKSPCLICDHAQKCVERNLRVLCVFSLPWRQLVSN